MDEPRVPPPPLPIPPVETSRLGRADILVVILLAVFTLGLRTFQLGTTEVTARDSIGYIHIAWRLEHDDWRKVIPNSPQHPGYPVAVLAASLPVRFLYPNDLPYAMQLAAQLASAAASILLVAPLYWLGVQLFNRRVAFGAVLLFQCLPCSGRIMADGLSEGVFLLFAVTALAAAMYALRSGSIVGFAVAGAASGLAYLTRPEGLVIPAAVGLTLLGMQFVVRWRRPWLHVLANGVVLTAAVLTVGGPYMMLIHGLTVKPTANAVMQDAAVDVEPTAPIERAAVGVADKPVLFAVWLKETDNASGRSLWALTTLGEVLSKAFFFVLWVPALVGLICFRQRFRVVPGAWMLLLVCTCMACLLYRVAVRMGYLSDRHTILILACGVLWAAAAVDGVGRGLAALLARTNPALAAKWRADGGGWATSLLLVVALGPLVRTLEPLHGDRAGFQTAGRWLAAHIDPDKGVFDPNGWAGYYAGRYFRSQDAVNTPCHYVVLEEGGSHSSHLVTVAEARQAATGGHVLCRFPATVGADPAEVVVYELPVPWVTRALP